MTCARWGAGWRAVTGWRARGLGGALVAVSGPCCAALPGLAILPVKLLAVALLSQGHVLAGGGAAGGQGGKARWRSRGFTTRPSRRCSAWPGFARGARRAIALAQGGIRQRAPAIHAWRLACVQWRPWRRRLRGWRQQEANAGDGAGRPSVASCVSLTAEQNPESPPTDCAPARNR